jgi:hypothetical protein
MNPSGRANTNTPKAHETLEGTQGGGSKLRQAELESLGWPNETGRAEKSV